MVGAHNGRKKLQVLEVGARGQPLQRELLRSTESFLLVSGARLWVWVGREAAGGERQKAMLYAQSFLQGKGNPKPNPNPYPNPNPNPNPNPYPNPNPNPRSRGSSSASARGDDVPTSAR